MGLQHGELHLSLQRTVPACGSSPTTVTIDNGAGGPIVGQLVDGGYPQLSYELQGQLILRPWCFTTQTDSNGAVSEARLAASQLVTGTFRYKATDTLAGSILSDGLLFDVEVTLDMGGVDIVGLFIDPEAS